MFLSISRPIDQCRLVTFYVKNHAIAVLFQLKAEGEGGDVHTFEKPWQVLDPHTGRCMWQDSAHCSDTCSFDLKQMSVF